VHGHISLTITSRMVKRGFLFVAIALGVAAIAMPLVAQVRPKVPPKPVVPAKPLPKKDAGAPVASSAPAVASSAPATMPTAEPANGDAGVVEVRSLGDAGQVIKFSTLDIEGRLRSPQLVYFLRRVRAEFNAGELGHRPFLRELSETRKSPSF
jgi:hypothetical protein